ncbi:MAG: ATP-dependent DNA helicase RecG [Bacilli bacterium]|nr:ATP-dependent DNA helicase RecG [Bacilli bacterium]
MDISGIKGIGTKTYELLHKLNIYTVDDLINYYPYRYNVIKVIPLVEAEDGEAVTIKGIVDTEPRVSYINRSLNRMSFKVLTDNFLINVTIFNRAFYKQHLHVGRMINLIGRYERKNNTFTASDIKFEIINGTKVEPVYHLVNGLKSKNLNKIINEGFKYVNSSTDYVPQYLVNKYEFINKVDALKELHNPEGSELLKKAKLRLIYEEFFQFMFKTNYLRYKYDLNNVGLGRDINREDVDAFISSLPFSLTVDQETAVNDIYNDLTSPKRMNRLVLGDVGSGKTVVAIIGLYINYLAGYQGSMMAPTEILARQHYANVTSMFKDTDIKVALLVGSMKVSEKKKVYQMLESGDIDILIGTHALISEGVTFKNLGFVITDEQHRFGVNQRSNLQNKGMLCDVLYLSATPIPRTYALTIYGDMDTSIIKTKPSGRKDIITKLKKESELKDVLTHMVEEIKEGHQIYVVAPLIEDEDGNSNLNDVVKLKEKFDLAFQNKIRVEILHGKMSNKDKDMIMSEYKNGDIKVLISTTVIEVGVDVKNSTMMVIFNAERFGLATLHQLRGRVGRNDVQSYCYLISNYDKERLHVMEESNDGFYISEQDFKLRGGGDLFGTRQSGDMVFKIGDLRRDYKILVQCKNDAGIFLQDNIKNDFKDYPQYKEIIKSLEFID